MKIAHLSFAVAAFAMGTSLALADDPQLQNRLAIQRESKEKEQKAVCIAVCPRERNLAPKAVAEKPSKPVFELRSNAHGQQFGMYAPAK